VGVIKKIAISLDVMLLVWWKYTISSGDAATSIMRVV
jgi:hypothetical protein